MKAQIPLCSACYATDRHWRVKSWDRFYIPKPFSRGVLVYGEPLTIPPDTPLEEAIAMAQRAMDDAQSIADGYFASGGAAPGG